MCKEEDPGPRAGAPGQERGEEAGALQERGEEAGVLVEQGRRNREEEMGGGRRRDREVIPCYSRQLRELVQADMITLGSLSAEQVSATKTISMSSPVSSRLRGAAHYGASNGPLPPRALLGWPSWCSAAPLLHFSVFPSAFF